MAFGKSRAGSEWVVNQALTHPYDAHGVPTEWLIVAETLSDARSICMEGPAGILRVLERRKIKHRYKMSPRPQIIFPNNSKIHTEGADNPDVARGLNLSGAWLDEICVAADEPVVTARGVIPVQDVRIGDRVMTRKGWRPVSHAGLTRRDAEILTIVTSAGTVRVTPEHRVFANGAWKMAEEVRPGDSMATCPPNIATQYSAMSRLSRTGMASVGTSTSGWATTLIGLAPSSIAQSGPKFMAPSPMDTRSITSIGSDGITGSQTSSCSPCTITDPSLRRNRGRTLPGERTRPQLPQLSDSLRIGSDANRARWAASSVVHPSSVPACGRSSALPHAETRMGASATVANVLSVRREVERSDVYDITVEGDAPEFFAGQGRLLVHNCKWKTPRRSWYEGIMPALRGDLICDHPRAFVTTTPKPIDILQEWVKRGDDSVHLIRGSTFDNARNLSQQVLKELKNRYEGTAIGLQELHGELIDAFDGALFSRLDIEDHRVADIPDNLISIVVGVDPSLTGEDDEMGIVVCGRDRDNHLYVLADRSIMGVGRSAAIEAWKVVAEFGADKLVCEVNLGKRWMQQVFQDAYKELVEEGLFPEHTKPPLVGIDTKIGKKTRAEPVAMRCEQGKLHLVGHQEKLEEQMATFVSWGLKDSPDRLDAMVHACRFLIDQERKAVKIASPRDVLSPTLLSLLQEGGSYRTDF